MADTAATGRALGTGTPIRVLHVDDEPDFAETVDEFLRRSDERITTVVETSVSAALSRLESDDVDCVVTDYQMPGRDGIEFIEAVRERDEELPCILYTGEGSEDVASDAIAAGATDYLQKQPGTEQYELLANRIVNAVESYRAQQRARTLERTRSVVREVNQALLRASTRAEIERGVCDILADSRPYRAAWIGTVDEATGSVECRASAGVDDGPLVTAGDSPRDAAGAGERVAVVETGPGGDGDDAGNGEVGTVATIPLDAGEQRGLLTVYASQPGTFGDEERCLLAELAGDVSHAIGAVETQHALRAERDRRAALFENTPNPIAEARFRDGDVAVTDVNEAFQETFGFDPRALEGCSVRDEMVPEGEEASHERVVEALRTGETAVLEVRRRTTDGVRDFLLTACPVALADERGAYVWYSDITERKELEAELQEQANLLDHLFGQIPTALYVKDTEGRHVQMSEYDVPPEDVVGKTDPEIYGETEFTRATYEDDMRVIEEGVTIRNKEEYNPATGEWTLTSKVPYYGEDGEIRGLIGVSRIITEKKEYERELKRKNERLEDFASVISHDLRNPLTVAIGQLEHYRGETDDPRLERTNEALERMETLIDDLLTLARGGQSIDETQAVALGSAAEEAWANVDTPGATLDVTGDCRFQADQSRLLQLFENLFRNSIEHGGPSVTVAVGPLENGFFLADDGPGVPEDERERVFEPGVTSAEDGTGFGLVIVEDIAEAHGWDVAVTESDAGGVRFEFTGVRLAD